MGALIVGSAYLLLAAVDAVSRRGDCAGWVWLALFFLVLTFGELFILPTGLGLFARLAPPHLGATTVAAWFLVIFSGSLTAGPGRHPLEQLQARRLLPASRGNSGRCRHTVARNQQGGGSFEQA